ncbi:MAG: GNAT family N-acetyltransferase [Gammaproteobacteria bacterium]|nr:MAG: GNAT family N-acetyltransferase [Gammaproteobacteria bacterium]RLA44912.1 MAG: GNAT family N-acetyltransferase [Gammaproteobacteria bacterium]
MNIQQATFNDLTAICELADQINTTHHHELPDLFLNPEDMEGSTEFWSSQFEAKSSAFLVAKIENTVVGFITAKITENTDIPFLTKRKICRIGTIVVLEEYQNSGVGSELMCAIEKWTADCGADEVRLEVMEFNESAQLFYNDKGYTNSSRIMTKVMA